MPKTVQRLVTQSTDAQRVGDTLSAAVQPTLNFLNAFFQSAADGSLQVTKPTTFQSTLTALSTVTLGATTLAATTVASLVATGVVTAGSFVSPTGFKSIVFGGTYGNASGAAATLYQHVAYNSNGNQNRLIQMPFAGSLIGISIQYQGSTTQSSIGVQVNKNNASLYPLTTLISSGATGAYANVKFAKGTYPFVAGDFLTVLSQYGTAGSIALQADLFVEMAT